MGHVVSVHFLLQIGYFPKRFLNKLTLKKDTFAECNVERNVEPVVLLLR